MFGKHLFLVIFCCSFGSIASAPRPRHSVDLDFGRYGEDFRGKIHVNGKPYELNLKRPASSVFIPSFRLTTAHAGLGGETVFTDVTPTNNWAELEGNIFEDEDANAVFRIHHIDGEMQLHGIMDNIHISHDGEEHFAIIHDVPSSPQPGFKDYVDTDELFEPDDSVDTRQLVSASPELLLFVDNEMWKTLKEDESWTLTYLAVLVRAVNNRYKTMPDPSIKFKVVSAVIMKDRESQPFIEKSKNSEGWFNMTTAFYAFSTYMYENAGQFPKHDLASMLTAEFYGKYQGMGRTSGGCRDVTIDGVRMSNREAISRDVGGHWKGIWTYAHELGQNMGARHDGDDGDPRCSYDDGYIMSYLFTKNQLTFSWCSAEQMKKHISSKTGACFRKDDAPSTWPESPKNPGEYLTMEQQCEKETNRLGAKPSLKKSPDELCAQLFCEASEESSDEWVAFNRTALDGTPCGTSGGRCSEGKCV